MNRDLEQLLQSVALLAPPFPANSRYHTVGTTVVDVGNRQVRCLQRRLVPPAESLEIQEQYKFRGCDRLDRVAFNLLGDPELFWRLCDANGVLHPEELQRPGRVLNVPRPGDSTGATYA